MTISRRIDETLYTHFTDEAPEELKKIYLEHYEVRDIDYQIFNTACDIISEVYANEAEQQRENKDERENEERITDCIEEATNDSASLYTSSRLDYLNTWNQDEIAMIVRSAQVDIADACAMWYEQQVKQAAFTIINNWIKG